MKQQDLLLTAQRLVGTPITRFAANLESLVQASASIENSHRRRPGLAGKLLVTSVDVTTPDGTHTRVKCRLADGPSVCAIAVDGRVAQIVDGSAVSFGAYC